jgi:pimeloyl-ACP methyl ester carboxylesterase
VLARGGVIDKRDAGLGGEMFILIHGASHSSRCWDRVSSLLDAEVLAIDLPGRGHHPAPLDRLRLADFIESAIDDIESSEATDAVVVGHSMAGLSIAGIVDRVHDRLRHIVFLSCTIPRHGESMVTTLPADLGKLAELAVPDPAGVFPGKKVIVQTMCEGMDEDQTAFTLDVCVPEAYWPMRDPVDLSGLRHPVPRTWVKLLRDRTPSPEQAEEFAERARCVDFVELDTGHFPMITHPTALAGVLNELHNA